MWTVGNATATVNAYKWLTGVVKIDGVDRAGLCALAASNAEPLSNNHPSSLPLRIGSRGARHDAGRWVARKTGPRFEARR